MWPFRQCTFRLLQFFNILNSSDFAHLPNLSFPMDVVYNSENRLSISFLHLREISKQTLGNIKKTGLILSSESVNMLIRGVVAAVRVVKIHSKSTPIVFFLYSKHFVSTPLIFRFHFSTTFNFQNAVKITQLVRLGI